MAFLFDGKRASLELRKKLLQERKTIKRDLTLAILFPDENSNQETFLKKKQEEGAELEVNVEVVKIPRGATTETYLSEIETHTYADGILIQLPIAEGVDKHTVLNAVPYEKDVEGLSSRRVGDIIQSDTMIYSPVAKAAVFSVEQALLNLGREPHTQHVCIVGYNDLTGKPAAAVLARRCGSVSLCGSRTADLSEFTSRADIIISGTGKTGFITPDMVKEKSILIDVGYETNTTGKISGDFDPACQKKAAFFTPVPGGIGPLTVTFIYENLISLATQSRD